MTLLILPEFTTSILAPIFSNCSVIFLFAPLPIETMTITVVIPIDNPIIAREVRDLLRSSVLQDNFMFFSNFMIWSWCPMTMLQRDPFWQLCVPGLCQLTSQQ